MLSRYEPTQAMIQVFDHVGPMLILPLPFSDASKFFISSCFAAASLLYEPSYIYNYYTIDDALFTNSLLSYELSEKLTCGEIKVREGSVSEKLVQKP